MKVLLFAAVATSFVSAALWFWSASLKPVYPTAWLGTPPEIVARINLQTRLNALAAATTGLSALLQSLALVTTP